MVVPPSGHGQDSAPLSLEYITMVLSSMPSSLSFGEQLADHRIMLDHAVRIDTEAGLAFPLRA